MKFERLVYYNKFKPDIDKPIFSFYNYTIYPTIVWAQHTEEENKEVVYLAFNTTRTEQVIIYLTEHRTSKRVTVKYWRSKEMDGEIAWLLLQAFIHEFLNALPNVRGKLAKRG